MGKMMRVGTIGAGVIVETFIQAVRNVENCEVSALYLREDEIESDFHKRVNVSKYHTTYDALFQDDEVDIIYIALPNSLHYKVTKQALKAGKHVICEKPFTSNKKEAQELVDLAKEKSLLLFEAITVVHMPNFVELKNAIPRVGKISLVQANYSQYSSKYAALAKGELPNVFNPQFSGGALMDINVYNIHAVVSLFGMPKNTTYYAHKHENGIDLSGIAILEYDEFPCVCIGAKDSKSQNYFQVQGDKGYVNVNKGINGVSSLSLVTQEEVQIDKQDKDNWWTYEVEAFKAIFDRKDIQTCYKMLEHSLQVMEVIDKLKASANIVFAADEGGQ